MSKLKSILTYFSTFELILWSSSVCAIILSFCIFDQSNILTLIASVLGVTAIIFSAKGNPFSQVLMIIFCLIYSYISWGFRYYGELATYLFMSLPMSTLSLITWLKNPFKGKHSEVTVNQITKRDVFMMILCSVLVTVAFYFILKFTNTVNLLPSTLSVTTSFIAAYLLYKRSPYFPLAYAVNDIVLIVLWILASFVDKTYSSVIVCFLAFLAADLYGFTNWLKLEKKQQSTTK